MVLKIFISHCWDYKEQYYAVQNWIEESNLNWQNMSVPEHSPKEAEDDSELELKLENNIKNSSIFIVISGMYVSQENRKWINKELDIAIKYNKPIIAIKPRGNERLPQRIQENADDIVNWNSQSLINAIKGYEKND